MANAESDSGHIEYCKEIIERQASELNSLRNGFSESKSRLKESDEKLAAIQKEVIKLQEQNVLLQQDLHEVLLLAIA